MSKPNEGAAAHDRSGTAAPSDLPPMQGPAGRPGGFGGRPRGPVVKPKNFTATLRRLWSFIGSERRLLTVIFLFLLVTAGIAMAAPWLIGRAVDAMGGADSGGPGMVQPRLLGLLVLALGSAYVTDAVLNFLQGWLMAGVSQRIVANLRQALFAKLQKLPLTYFDSRPHGEIMSRLSNDIDNVSSTISQSTTQLMAGLVAIAGSLVMMIVLSPVLTLASLITVPMVYFLGRTITRRTGKLFKEQQAQLGRMNGHIEETISGLHVVKAFNYEDRAVRDFEEMNGKLYEVGLRAQIYSGYMMPLLGVINNIGFAAVAVTGGIMAVNGSITVGLIASFLGYSRQFVRPLNDMANIYNILQSGVAGAERVFEVLDEGEETADRPGAVELKHPVGRVVFDRVSFGYRVDVPILKEVSFEAEAGSSTAFIGPTGAGKTTIINLLTRFYDVTGGTITIDGRDIRDYTRDSLRRCFGIVLQDTYLFSGTIKDNIKYGKPDASDEEVAEAAEMANADGFIRRLPKQYDTVLSENGGGLSQGQRQLLAIARAILAKPSILILDEATSSIDTRTELHIQDALLKLMQGRTSFIIAHRLNTIRDADMIRVIDRGTIAESGTHDELLRKEGLYRQMVYNQFKHAPGALE